MLEGGQAQGIFVNIFGGINKCDIIAEGIVKAAGIVAPDGGGMPVPVVVRLEGTNVKRGRQILQDAAIKNVIAAPTMEGGAEQIVKLVKENENA
jgi:succinyl-CoA synthetase beta subunit